MKKALLLTFFLLITQYIAIAQHFIIPTPVSYTAQNGSFTYKPQSTPIIIQDCTPQTTQIIQLYWQQIIQTPIPAEQTNLQKSDDSYISIQLLKNLDTKLDQEGYVLEILNNTLQIKANTTTGIFYGLQTLAQLLPINKAQTITIPNATIIDYPGFKWRGLMLDVSRHFFTPDQVKQYIDWMAKYKFNVLHWHLTDDHGWRVQIKAYPKLTEIGAWRVERHGTFGDRQPPKETEKPTYGGFYTQEQIKDIVQYATQRQINIVPEIDVPGHSMALLAAYPELSTKKQPKLVNPGSKFSHWHGDGTFTMSIENCLDPSNPKVYSFLDTVFTEIATLFPSPYIHIGGDECYHGYWEKDANCQALMKQENLKDGKELQSFFIKKIEKIISSKSKKMIGWDEILDGGLAENALVMSWRGTKGGTKAAELGHQVIMSPNTNAYLDFMQGDPSVEIPVYNTLTLKKAYDFEPVPNGINPKYILGGQANLWTEKVPTIQHAFYMTYPRAFATAESVWSPAKNKDWDNFLSRVAHHFTIFDAAQIPICKAIYDPIVKTKISNTQLQCTLSSELPDVDLYYTLDGTFPANYSTKYTQPFTIPDADITLRVIAYKNQQPIGRILTIAREMLKKRAGK